MPNIIVPEQKDLNMHLNSMTVIIFSLKLAVSEIQTFEPSANRPKTGWLFYLIFDFLFYGHANINTLVIDEKKNSVIFLTCFCSNVLTKIS